MTWEQVIGITEAGRKELEDIGINASTAWELQRLGYTGPGDMLLLDEEQLDTLCKALPPMQHPKVRELAKKGRNGTAGPTSTGPVTPSKRAPQLPTTPLRSMLGSVFKWGHAAADAKAQAQLVQLVNECCGISGVVALLKGVSAGDQEKAAQALMVLAADSKEQMAEMVAAGAIPSLVALLTSGSTRVKERAAGVLQHLAAGSEEQKAKIDAEDAIPPLVDLLKHSSGAQKYARGR